LLEFKLKELTQPQRRAMKRPGFVFYTVTGIVCMSVYFIITAFQAGAPKAKWSIKASYYESCSCNAPCPCPFGLPMTNSYCKLNAILVIHSGSYNKIDLNGTKLIVSGSSGKWGTYYFDDKASTEQKAAIEKILAIVNPGGFDTILSSSYSKIQFEDENGKIAFSAPNIEVEMNTVKGNHNKPVLIQNLRGKLFRGYIPCLSQTNFRSFSDAEHDFSFKQKAGFCSNWNLNQDDFK
jgi:Protein of unknown function (DUF1326)